MIYTFYSYKGGVGRSMALANVAEYFYRRGLKVLIIDWDLEAPGLETFFCNVEEDDLPGGEAKGAGSKKILEIRSQLGLIDMLLAYKRTYPGIQFNGDAATDKKVETLREHLPSIKHHLYALRAPGSLEDYPQAALWLLPAGWREEGLATESSQSEPREGDRFSDYSQAVQAFDWNDFYATFNGLAYFEWMRAEMEAIADVILIDSRTGVTEMGGVCTRQLADVVVSFSVLNRQNIEGVARMNDSFKRPAVRTARGGRDIQVVAVPTRIDTSELQIRQRLVDRFQVAMGPVPPVFNKSATTFWSLKIPYISQFAYLERLAVGAAEAPELEGAYVDLATRLVLLARDNTVLKTTFTKDLDRLESDRPFRSNATLPPQWYTPRLDELSKLRQALLASKSDEASGSMVVLEGGAGCGKSVLAAAACQDRRVMEAFRDGIVWVTLGPSPNTREKLTKAHEALTGDKRRFRTEAQAADAFSASLGHWNGMLVLDDMWREEDLRPFMQGGAYCTRLVTTRDPRGIAQGATKVMVGGMKPGGVAQIIAAVAKIPVEYFEAAEVLADDTEWPPLLSKLAGEALRRRRDAGDDLPSAIAALRELRQQAGPLAFDEPGATGRNQSVAESVAASLPLLDQSEVERYAMLLVSMPEGQAPFGMLQELCGGNQAEAEKLLRRFRALSLLEPDTGDGFIRLHPLLRAHLLKQIPTSFALNARAETALTALLPEQQTIARSVLTRLVKPGSPTEPGRDTPARVSLASFDEQSRQVLKALHEAQIVWVNNDGAPTAQLTDDGFVHRWERLAGWVNEDREFLFWRQQFSLNAEGWVARGHAREELLKGAALGEAKSRLAQRRADLTPDEIRYIEESQRAAFRRWAVAAVVVLAMTLGLIAGAMYVREVSRQSAADAERRQKELQQQQEEAARRAQENRGLADAAYAQGLGALEKGDFDAAIVKFSEAINFNSNWSAAYKGRGISYLKKGYRALAIGDFNTTIALSPSDAEAYLYRGTAFAQLGDANRARANFNQALEQKPVPVIEKQIRDALNNLNAPPQAQPTATPPVPASQSANYD